MVEKSNYVQKTDKINTEQGEGEGEGTGGEESGRGGENMRRGGDLSTHFD